MNLLFAFLLDLLLGDPERCPHPVRWIGWLINKLENILRGKPSPISLSLSKGEGKRVRVKGILLVILVCSITWLITFAAVFFAGRIHPLLGLCVEIFLIYLTLSVKSLGNSAMEVMNHLKRGDLKSARISVSKIVGRDTENMTEEEVTRAAVETVAENTVDGIISPLFFAFLGGAPLAMMFKAVSTLDSMVGYKNEQYIHFGRASAKLDDWMNWIPARVSLFLIPLSAFFLRMNVRNSFKTALRDGNKHPSPNSGIAESAFAGALGVQLGGVNYRLGKPVNYPLLGDCQEPLTLEDIQGSVRLSFVASCLWVFILYFLQFDIFNFAS